MNVLAFPVQYVATALFFVFRPGQFFAERQDRARFAGPLSFLITSVALAALAATTAATVAESASPQPSRTDMLLVLSAIAIGHALVASLFGKLTGLLLNERVDAIELLEAFCYTSVWYVPLAVTIPFTPDSFDQMNQPVTVVTTIVQVVAVAYLLTSMARVSALFGRRLVAFCTVAGTFLVIAMLLVAAGTVIWLIARDEQYPAAEVVSTGISKGSPVGAVTVGVQDVTASSVQLIGAPIGKTTVEWFEFDSVHEMRYPSML